MNPAFNILYWILVLFIPAIMLILIGYFFIDYIKRIFDKTAGKEIYAINDNWNRGKCHLCTLKAQPIQELPFHMIKYIENEKVLRSTMTIIASVAMASLLSAATGSGHGGFMTTNESERGYVINLVLTACNNCCENKLNRAGNKIAIAPYEFCKHTHYNDLRKKGFEFIASEKLAQWKSV